MCIRDRASTDLPRMLAVTGTMSVPLYNGGAVRNAIRAADTRVVAGRNDLRATEANIFAQTVACLLYTSRCV